MSNNTDSLPPQYASLFIMQLLAMLCVCIASTFILTSTSFIFKEASMNTISLYTITFLYVALFAFFLIQGALVVMKVTPPINDSDILKSIGYKMVATAIAGGILAFVVMGVTVMDVVNEPNRDIVDTFLPHHISFLSSILFITAISFFTAKKTVETSIAQKEVENVTGPDGSFPE